MADEKCDRGATRSDTERLEWLMDILQIGDDSKADAKMMAFSGALLLQKTGRDAIDCAMQALEDAVR